MKKLLLFNLVIFLVVGSIIFAQSPERERPHLIDFGASLRPGYIKKKAEPENSKPKTNDSEDNDIIRVDTDLVVTDLLVVNDKGFAVNGLKKNDFIVSEDKTPQTIDTFSQGEGGTVPRSIVLVMDYSGSLRPYIKTSVAAAKVLVDKLKPQDRMAIVTDDVELLTNFTRDKKLLKEKLDTREDYTRSRKFGRSKQFSALLATLNELFDMEDIRPIVIFQTDGDEYSFLKGNFQHRPAELANLSVPPSMQELISERTFSYQDIVTAAEKARATVYSIIPGRRFLGLLPDEQMAQARLSQEDRTNAADSDFARRRSKESIERNVRYYADLIPRIHKSVASVAITSGGWAEYLETPDKADSIYSKVLTDINNRYLIGYYPTNQTRDGKRRTVKIEVRNHPEYRIFARRSYYAPESR